MADFNASVDQIDRWIARRCLNQAYRAVLLGLEAHPGDVAMLAASSRLPQALRSRGWDLGVSKATEMSDEIGEIEVLIRLVIRLNWEGMYEATPDGR